MPVDIFGRGRFAQVSYTLLAVAQGVLTRFTPGISLRVSITMNIRGLVRKQGVSRPVNDLTCPFELSGNSV